MFSIYHALLDNSKGAISPLFFIMKNKREQTIILIYSTQLNAKFDSLKEKKAVFCRKISKNLNFCLDTAWDKKKTKSFLGMKKGTFNLKYRFLAIIVSTLFVDQFTKFLVQRLMFEGESIAVLPPVFYLTLVRNPGAAFGMLAGQTIFLIMITLLLLAAAVVLYDKIVKSPPIFQIGTGLILGGAIGNLIDRLYGGTVTDFLDFRVWPVFNFADVGIVVGVGIIIYSILIASKKATGKDDEDRI